MCISLIYRYVYRDFICIFKSQVSCIASIAICIA